MKKKEFICPSCGSNDLNRIVRIPIIAEINKLEETVKNINYTEPEILHFECDYCTFMPSINGQEIRTDEDLIQWIKEGCSYDHNLGNIKEVK